jgi:transcriptional regulator with XRE-family HTH domain
VSPDRHPVGPTAARLAELRQVLTVKEISRATGLGLTHLFSLSRPNRQTVPAATAKAIFAVDPDNVGLRLSDMPRFSGGAFKAARLRRGHSQSSLEVQAGVAIGTLYHWEAGLCTPLVSTLLRVMEALGVDFEEVSERPGETEEDFDVYLQPARHVDDTMAAYPCGVCGEMFRSRIQLATHPHPKKGGE